MNTHFSLPELKVLSSQQIEQFVEEGYTLLRGAFPKSVAAQIRDLVWERLGLSPQRPQEWTKPVIHLAETVEGPVVAQAFTSRLHGAMDDVMGQNRWNPVSTLGWWPVSFPGFESGPWQEPSTGWHIDGIQFHHHLNSPDQGLLPIFLLSDIGPGDGGTALSIGSHRECARALAQAEPEGLDAHSLSKQVAAAPRERVIEANGEAGDVMLIHPFVLHARSMNVGKKVRFICNPCYTLKEPMQFDRPDSADHSPVERAIVEALHGA